MRGKPYSLFKRGRVWYVQFKKDNNSFSTAKSTGLTSKGAADLWALEYLRSGQVVVHERVTLSEYTKDFFAWDGRWATDKRVRGVRISERECVELERVLKNHVLLPLGNLRLTEIDRACIKNFRNSLFLKEYAGSTINKALSVIKSIMEAAEEDSLIQAVPRMERAALNCKSKGILTIEEVQRLFLIEWDDFRGQSASLIAAATGLRMGEILGLVIDDVHLDSGYLHCRRSWDQKFRRLNPTTKTGRARNVMIPPSVQAVIGKLIQMNPYRLTGDTFLFYADKSHEYPTEPNTILKSFYRAMEKIGITEEHRRSRNVTFHSHRHFLNSLLVNAKIPLHKIQAITGHLTTEMTQHYYHLDDMSDVKEVQGEVFGFNVAGMAT